MSSIEKDKRRQCFHSYLNRCGLWKYWIWWFSFVHGPYSGDLLDWWSMFSHGTSHGVNAKRQAWLSLHQWLSSINPQNMSGHTQGTNCIYISSQFIYKSRKASTELHTSFIACKSAIYVAGHFLNCHVNAFIVMNHILEFRLLNQRKPACCDLSCL